MQIIEKSQIELENKAVEIIQNKIKEVLKDKDYFNLILTGGNSVTGIYQDLQTADINWEKVNIFLTDERNVPISDSDSNYFQLKQNLLDYIKIPDENVYFFNTDTETQTSLVEYNENFKNKTGGYADLVLLSVGEDGHIASIFPRHESVDDTSDGYIFVDNSPKPPKERFSVSKKVIKSTKTAIILFFGKGKFDAFQEFNNPLLDETDCPAQIVNGVEDLYVLADVIK